MNMAVSTNEDIMEDQPLLEMFLKTGEEFTHPGKKRQKKEVFLEILQKVKNVTSTDAINVSREGNIVRGSKNKETQLALCQGLDSKSAAAKNEFKDNEPTG